MNMSKIWGGHLTPSGSFGMEWPWCKLDSFEKLKPNWNLKLRLYASKEPSHDNAIKSYIPRSNVIWGQVFKVFKGKRKHIKLVSFQPSRKTSFLLGECLSRWYKTRILQISAFLSILSGISNYKDTPPTFGSVTSETPFSTKNLGILYM